MDNDKLTDEDVRNPHMSTMNIAAQIMKKVQQVITRDPSVEDFLVSHVISIHDGKVRLGEYSVSVFYADKNSSCTFDLQMMLDLRYGEWKTHVEMKTVKLLKDLVA